MNQQELEVIPMNIYMLDGDAESISLEAYPSNTFGEINEAVWDSLQNKPSYAKSDKFKVFQFIQNKIKKQVDNSGKVSTIVSQKVCSFALLWSPSYQKIKIFLNNYQTQKYIGSYVNLSTLGLRMFPQTSEDKIVFTIDGNNLAGKFTIEDLVNKYGKNFTLNINLLQPSIQESVMSLGVNFGESSLQIQESDNPKVINLIIQLQDLGESKTINLTCNNAQTFKEIIPEINKKAKKLFEGWGENQAIKIFQGGNVFQKSDKPLKKIFQDMTELRFEVRRQYPGG